MLNKKVLRKICRQNRQSLPHQMRQIATLRANRVLKFCIKRGKNIAVYFPIGSEMRLDEFVRTAQKRGAKIYLPYIEPRQLRLWFTPYSTGKSERSRGSGSLKVPQFSGKKIRVHRLNTLILPIVSIDKMGYRLGQGGGYYDATLAQTRHIVQPKKIAVGFACQQIDALPHEAHDCRVDAFVSEQSCYWF